MQLHLQGDAALQGYAIVSSRPFARVGFVPFHSTDSITAHYNLGMAVAKGSSNAVNETKRNIQRLTNMNNNSLKQILNKALLITLLGLSATSTYAYASDSKESEAAKIESAKKSESGKSEEKDKDKDKEDDDGDDDDDKDSSEKDSKNGSGASSIQSSVRPYGLQIVDTVQQAGSDDASKKFQGDVLPSVTKLVNETLGESHKLDDSAYLLDPSKLKLKTDSDVRVYFVGEGAGYANTLGFTTDGSGRVDSDSAKLIFPNASSSVSMEDSEDDVKRTEKEPLLPGDFVNLGHIKGGSALDFFLVANGANGGKNVFSTQRSENPDGINHVVSFAYMMKDSPYLILGFEDLLGGGDRDFNDVLFAVDIGEVNVAALTATPEPATVASMGAFLALGWVLRRRQAASAK